ncbi:MAG: HD domain-containing protein [Elusimicrobia bacterium]|nr:HD domain-containing protein [Elusimicrobiota bacterium]
MARRARKSRADNQRWEHMVQALRLMNFTFNNVKLYPPTHTEVAGSIGKLHELLTPILEEQEDVGFGFMDELLYIEGSMSLEETAQNQMLVDRFNRCRVKYLTLMKGLSKDDLLGFFTVINAEATKPTTEHPAELIEKKGIKTIHLIEAEVDELASKSKMLKKKTLFDWYQKAVATLSAAQLELRDKEEADLKALYRLVDDMMATIRSKGPGPFLLLPLLGAGMDPHLTHAVNTAILSCALGDAYGLNTGQINTLCAAAYLHDLGRITIPPEWAADHTPLSREEREVARQHADWGFKLLLRNEEVPPQTAVLAAEHHSPALGKPEGDGYHPDVFHKILALADAYDLARTTDKYYWKKHPQERALWRIVNRRGVLFDATLVKLLVNAVGFYPIGTLVRVDDGRRGIVVRAGATNPARPKLFLFEEAGTPASPGEEPPPVILDLGELGEDGLGFKHSITSVLKPEAGLDLRAEIDKKKEYLLSYTI